MPPFMTAHADVFGFYVPDVYDEITENVKETNDILTKAFNLSQTSPYTVVNAIPVGGSRTAAITVHNASITVSLVVASFLLLLLQQ